MSRNSPQNELNAKIKKVIWNTAVMEGMGTNYLYISPIAGYALVNAYNGDWNASQHIPLGIAYQGPHYVLFFNSIKEQGYPIRINMIWAEL